MILKPIVSLFFMKTIAFSFITPPSLNNLYETNSCNFNNFIGCCKYFYKLL